MPTLVPPPGSLILWLEADVGVYKDTAGTLPATTSGDLVALWRDQSGNGNDVLQATSGNRPAYRPGVAGSTLKPALQFTQASTTYLATAGSVAHGIAAGGFWFAAVWQPGTSGTNVNQTALAFGASEHPTICLPLLPSGGGPYRNQYLYSGVISAPFSNNVNDATWYLTEIVRASNTIAQYQSSAGATPTIDSLTYSDSTSIANASFNVGWDQNGADASNGYIAEILLYNASLSPSFQAQLENYLKQKYWNTPPPIAPSTATVTITTRPVALPLGLSVARATTTITARAITLPLTASLAAVRASTVITTNPVSLSITRGAAVVAATTTITARPVSLAVVPTPSHTSIVITTRPATLTVAGGGPSAGALVATVGHTNLVREVPLGYEEGIFTRVLPNGQMRGLTFPKLTAGNAALLGYLFTAKIPANLTVTTGLTIKLLVTDDGNLASDLGKAVVFGITPKLITPNVSNSDLAAGASAEQTFSVTLGATSGVLVLAAISLSIAQLGTAGAGSYLEFRLRRVGSSSLDTASGTVLVMPPVDVYNT